MIFLLQESYGQFMEVESHLGKKLESRFKIEALKRFNISANTWGMVDASAEFLRLDYTSKNGFRAIFSLYGTRIFVFASKDDKINTLSQLLLPNGGLINGSLFTTLPLKTSGETKMLFTTQLGERWINAVPLVEKNKPNFLNTVGSLGVSFQHMVFEDLLQNQSLFFWATPHARFNHSSVAEREKFFGETLDPFAWGYGLEVGLDLRPGKGALQFFVLTNKIQNVNNAEDFGKWCVRATLLYIF